MLLRLRNSVASMTGMVREQERTAHNLSNAGTIGFKRERAFLEVLSEQIDSDGAPHSTRATHLYADFASGELEQTGNRFDLAIEGEGFFMIADEETGETRYTRAGRFTPDADGTLRSPNGMQLESDDGAIQIPLDAAEIEFRTDGVIVADGQQVGRLSIVSFEDLTMLERKSGAEFSAPEDAETIEASGGIRQGYVERSNADPLQAMTGMIKHLRLFEMQQRMLRSTDENLSSSVRSLGRF